MGGSAVLCVDVECYLHGVLALPAMLSRLAVQSVITEQLHLPLKISAFLKELYSGCQLLSLKNDGLRRKFDSIKYDVKKVEDVVFELKVRGLLPEKKDDKMN
eukprot:TRINITY_DN17496_c0_g1_i1.p1 TRINITY_DN17496_c0_g1~~TRINITY_DN17496_c0_g1_i1.p1  ORF type:complete len:102 (+),score=24.14 TRINITY_DN17496_c0_g1_i1:292-597(+)